jgi:hypothetical protein
MQCIPSNYGHSPCAPVHHAVSLQLLWPAPLCSAPAGGPAASHLGCRLTVQRPATAGQPHLQNHPAHRTAKNDKKVVTSGSSQTSHWVDSMCLTSHATRKAHVTQSLIHKDIGAANGHQQVCDSHTATRVQEETLAACNVLT